MALTEKSRPFLFCTDGCSDISINYVNKVIKKMESLDGAIPFFSKGSIMKVSIKLEFYGVLI